MADKEYKLPDELRDKAGCEASSRFEGHDESYKLFMEGVEWLYKESWGASYLTRCQEYADTIADLTEKLRVAEEEIEALIPDDGFDKQRDKWRGR